MPYLVFTPEEVAAMPGRLQAELFAQGSRATQSGPNPFTGFDMINVVDLTTAEAAELLKGVHPTTLAGLKVFAEHGPIIGAELLAKAGITNFAHFQGTVTKRTRTVTRNPKAYLTGWDAWEDDVHGRYAVTEATHRSLRQAFKL